MVRSKASGAGLLGCVLGQPLSNSVTLSRSLNFHASLPIWTFPDYIWTSGQENLIYSTIQMEEIALLVSWSGLDQFKQNGNSWDYLRESRGILYNLASGRKGTRPSSVLESGDHTSWAWLLTTCWTQWSSVRAILFKIPTAKQERTHWALITWEVLC